MICTGPDPLSECFCATAIDNVASLIALAPLTDKARCINDTSVASNVSFKSHRSTNAFVLNQGLTTPYAGEVAAEIGLSSYWAMTETAARTVLTNCQTASAAGLSHLAYTQPSRFNKGGDVIGGSANYQFADTHAKTMKLSQTLNPVSFMWGLKNYGGGGGTILQQNGTPVQG